MGGVTHPWLVLEALGGTVGAARETRFPVVQSMTKVTWAVGMALCAQAGCIPKRKSPKLWVSTANYACV